MPPQIRWLVMMTLLDLSHSNDQLINSVILNASDADNDANAVNVSADDDDVNDGCSVDGYWYCYYSVLNASCLKWVLLLSPMVSNYCYLS